MIATDANAGFEIGIITFKKIANSFAPSIREDSVIAVIKIYKMHFQKIAEQSAEGMFLPNAFW